MSKGLFCTSLALILYCFASGCIFPVPVPGKTESSPKVSGRVLNARTLRPISGAQILSYDEPEISVLSDENGRYELPAVNKSYLISFHTPCPIYYFPPTGDSSRTISVSHPNYQPITRNLTPEFVTDDEYGFIIKDVMLEPKSQNGN
jgi:hypothetical protein